MTPDTSKIMLEEMRHAFDAVYTSLQKYSNKALLELGAELTFLLFYMSNDEIGNIKATFANTQNGWYIFALLAIISFIASATLFIVAMSHGKWLIPPHNEALLDKKQYLQMYDKELTDELIAEYNHDIPRCIKKLHLIRVLSDIGLHIMVFGAICLLIIQLFSS